MAERSGRPAVVLRVEDDPGDQMRTRRALTEAPLRTDLRMVADGEAALDYLRHRGDYTTADAPTPDLILLDLNMPKLDGREVLRHVKVDQQLRRIPVVILTTSRQPADIACSYDLGCNSFITKPVDGEKFMRQLRQLHQYWFALVQLSEVEKILA